MKKEIIICVIVIFTVIAGNVVTQNNTKKNVNELNENLNTLKQNLINTNKNEKSKNKEEYKNKSNSIKTRWDQMQEILSFYIEHDELEKVETQLVTINGQMESMLYDEAVAEIEKCQFILEHIEDKTAFNIKNIF